MKPRDAAIDAYAIEFQSSRQRILRAISDAPWLNLKIEYDALHRQVWIWVLLVRAGDAKSAYERLVNQLGILDIDEARCELNLSFMCRLPAGRTGHVADLCGKRDVVSFRERQVRDDDIIVAAASAPNPFST